jgi:hypothetical protein
MGPTNQRVARQRLFRFKKAVDEARLHHRSVRRDGGATYMPPPSPPEKNASDSKRHRSCESVFSKNVNSRDSASAANSGSAISQINTCKRTSPSNSGPSSSETSVDRKTCWSHLDGYDHPLPRPLKECAAQNVRRFPTGESKSRSTVFVQKGMGLFPVSRSGARRGAARVVWMTCLECGG